MASIRSAARAALIGTALLATAAQAKIYEEEYWTRDTDVRVKAFDGVSLKANVFIPNDIKEGEKRPVIIFINSWVLGDTEYVPEAKNLAKKGYIVFSYATRGFGQSTGLIDTNGPNDFKDVKKVIDYVLAHYPADPMNIGFAGVSYGAGISLTAIAQEPRIKTVVAMSAWGDLVASLFPGETPNNTWLKLLVGTGKLTGYLDSVVSENWNNMNTYSNVPETFAWGQARSPIHYIDKMNARLNDTDPTHPKPSIFISNSLADYLFRPNSVFQYFSEFQGEKRIQLNPGIHGSNLGGSPAANITMTREWQRVFDWFDYQLKGENTRIMERSPVTLQVKFVGQEGYDTWPLPENIQENYSFNLLPRDETEGADKNGGLSQDPATTESVNTIIAGTDSGASMGTPISAEFKEQHFGNPIVLDTASFAHEHGLWLAAPAQAKPMYIRGIPRLSFWLKEPSNETQVISYLYDLDPETGKVTFITQGPLTYHQNSQLVTYKTKVDESGAALVKLDVEMNFTGYNLPAGHQLALAMDTQDDNYYPYVTTPYEVHFAFGPSTPNELFVPGVIEPPQPQVLPEPATEDLQERGLGDGSASGYSTSGGAFNLGLVSALTLLMLKRRRIEGELQK